MKPLIMATLAACSVMAFANEATKSPTGTATPTIVSAKTENQKRPQLTPEQRAEMRAKREKMKAELRAKIKEKSVGIIKKYDIDDAKAKALFDELQAHKYSATPFEAFNKIEKSKRAKAIAESKAELEEKLLATIKKYGLVDKKAKLLLNELQTPLLQLLQLRPMKSATEAK